MKFNFSYGSATYTENYVFNVTLSDELNDDGSVLYNFEYVSSDIFSEGFLIYNPVFTNLGLAGYVDDAETIQVLFELKYVDNVWVVTTSQVLVNDSPVSPTGLTVELQKIQ